MGNNQQIEEIKGQKLLKNQLLIKLQMKDPNKSKMVPIMVFREEADNLGMIIKNEDIQTLYEQSTSQN